MKFSSVRVVSRDVPALAAFYGRVTGTAPVGTPDYTEVATPGATLALCSPQALQAASPGVEAAEALANTSIILEFEVDDVDAVQARLAESITEWVQEPTDQPWGNRSMLVRDPDGNLVNLFTPVAGAARDWPSQTQG